MTSRMLVQGMVRRRGSSSSSSGARAFLLPSASSPWSTSSPSSAAAGAVHALTYSSNSNNSYSNSSNNKTTFRSSSSSSSYFHWMGSSTDRQREGPPYSPCFLPSTITRRHFAFWSKKPSPPDIPNDALHSLSPSSHDTQLKTITDSAPSTLPPATQPPPAAGTGSSTSPFSDFVDKNAPNLLSSSSSDPASATAAAPATAAAAGEGTAAVAIQTLENWPSDHAIRILEFLHDTTGMPFWATIVGATLILRSTLFPLVIMTARNAAKMTIMRPEMDAITERIKAAPTGDRQAQQRYQKELYGLFDKYQCSPFRSFVGPLANIAVFVPMFFGLRKMGEYGIPGFNEGGLHWFTDLGAADPTYILPGLITLSFLAVTEIGMDGVQMQVSPQIKMVFRVLPIVFVPFTAQMPVGCLLYWGSSNLFSIGQTLLLRNPALKRRFGIPDIPKKAQSMAADANPFQKLLDSFEEKKRLKATAEAEIMHGGRLRPPPPPPSSSAAAAARGGKGGGMMTYAQRPPRAGKK